jgi:hypothetical protein
LAADDEVIHRVLDGLQMLNLVEIHKESYAPETQQILERFLGRQLKPTPEGADASIGIRYLVLAHRTWICYSRKNTHFPENSRDWFLRNTNYHQFATKSEIRQSQLSKRIHENL